MRRTRSGVESGREGLFRRVEEVARRRCSSGISVRSSRLLLLVFVLVFVVGVEDEPVLPPLVPAPVVLLSTFVRVGVVSVVVAVSTIVEKPSSDSFLVRVVKTERLRILRFEERVHCQRTPLVGRQDELVKERRTHP
jgi:hypothetical protein